MYKTLLHSLEHENRELDTALLSSLAIIRVLEKDLEILKKENEQLKGGN